MKAQLHIVDILDSTDFSRGLKQLSNAHLLFGMFHGKELKTINELSFSNHIPVVYALPTLTSPVSGNQYFILGSATLRSHCEYLFEYVYRRHFGDRVLLVGRKQVAQEMEVLSYFQSLNQKKTEAGLYPLPWIVFQDTGRLALRNLADSLSHLLTNVVILASNDAQFINSIMHHLSKHAEKSIKLIGMPGWRTLERISPSLLDSFDCLISTSFFYERTDSAVQHFRNNYQARFLVPPSEHALRGYDHGKYFGNQLAQFGRWMLGVFPPPASPPVASVFKVVPVMQGENVLYRENKGVFLLRYTQGKWQRFSGS
ncbi:MAG: hypothetical protein NZL95_06600 [Chitinophagales bacterium]|nr:hypothetical protein [Chitinophagales bacterium]MDW8428207.1 hypothetical protein [Chitinophagales bacterium]